MAHQAPLSMGILQARVLKWVAMPSFRDLPNPGIKPKSPTLQMDSLLSEPPGKPKNAGEGSLSLLQRIFSTQEWNWGLLHCRQILTSWAIREAPYWNTTHQFKRILLIHATLGLVSKLLCKMKGVTHKRQHLVWFLRYKIFFKKGKIMTESRAVVARGWGEDRQWVAEGHRRTGGVRKGFTPGVQGGCMFVIYLSKCIKLRSGNWWPSLCVNYSSIKMILKYDAGLTIWAMEGHSQYSNKVSRFINGPWRNDCLCQTV